MRVFGHKMVSKAKVTRMSAVPVVTRSDNLMQLSPLCDRSLERLLLSAVVQPIRVCEIWYLTNAEGPSHLAINTELGVADSRLP